MRPGQTAPECQRAAKQAYDPDTRFNEAGADCPGMLSCSFHWTWRQGCFNEAGADCPGMPDNRLSNLESRQGLQ